MREFKVTFRQHLPVYIEADNYEIVDGFFVFYNEGREASHSFSKHTIETIVDLTD